MMLWFFYNRGVKEDLDVKDENMWKCLEAICVRMHTYVEQVPMGRSLLAVHSGIHCIHPVYLDGLFSPLLLYGILLFAYWKKKKKEKHMLDLKIPAFGFKLIK